MELFHLSRLNTNSTNYTKVKDKKSGIILDELLDKSARGEAKKITEGKAKPKFLGKKGSAVYQQEYFSLVNQNNRDHNWKQKFKVLNEELEKNNPELLASLKIKYQNFNPNNR